MAYSPREALIKSKSPAQRKLLGSPEPLIQTIVQQVFPKTKNSTKKTDTFQSIVHEPPILKKSIAKSQSTIEVIRKPSYIPEQGLNQNTSVKTLKPSSSTKHKPKKKIICEQATDKRPRTYGKYSKDSLVKKSSKGSSRPSISFMPMSIEEVQGEDGSQTHRIKADLEEGDNSSVKQHENPVQSITQTSQKKQLRFAKALSLLVNEFDNKVTEATNNQDEANPEKIVDSRKTAECQDNLQQPTRKLMTFKKAVLNEKLGKQQPFSPNQHNLEYQRSNKYTQGIAQEEKGLATVTITEQVECPTNSSIEQIQARGEEDEHLNQLRIIIKQHLKSEIPEVLPHMVQSSLEMDLDMVEDEDEEEELSQELAEADEIQPYQMIGSNRIEVEEQIDCRGMKERFDVVLQAKVQTQAAQLMHRVEEIMVVFGQNREEPKESAVHVQGDAAKPQQVEEPKVVIPPTQPITFVALDTQAALPRLVQPTYKQQQQLPLESQEVSKYQPISPTFAAPITEPRPKSSQNLEIVEPGAKQLEYFNTLESMQQAPAIDAISSIPFSPSVDHSVISNMVIEDVELHPLQSQPAISPFPQKSCTRPFKALHQIDYMRSPAHRNKISKEEEQVKQPKIVEERRNLFIVDALLKKRHHESPYTQKINSKQDEETSERRMPVSNSIISHTLPTPQHRLLSISRSQELLSMDDLKQRVEQSVEIIRSNSLERNHYRKSLLRISSTCDRGKSMSRAHPLEEIDHYIESMLANQSISLSKNRPVEVSSKIAAEKVQQHATEVSDNFIRSMISAVLKVNRRLPRQHTLEQLYNQNQLVLTRLPRQSVSLRLGKLRQRIRNISKQAGSSMRYVADSEGQQLDRKLLESKSLLVRIQNSQGAIIDSLAQVRTNLVQVYCVEPTSLGNLLATAGICSHLFEPSPSADTNCQIKFNKNLIGRLVARLAGATSS